MCKGLIPTPSVSSGKPAKPIAQSSKTSSIGTIVGMPAATPNTDSLTNRTSSVKSGVPGLAL